MKNLLLIICLLMSTGLAFGETTADENVQEEMGKFSEESTKLRENHIQAMRELHVKHINEVYDRKLAHSKEMSGLWKQLKPGDKEGNKAIRAQVKKAQEDFRKSEEEFKKDFKTNVLKAKNKEFQASMKTRLKGMKGKFKD